MRIGQLAAEAGVTVQTVRFYERRGLIAAPTRRESGYRDYSRTAVDEVRSVLRLKALGFTLAEIRAALRAHAGDGELCRLAAHKVHALEAEIHRLTQVLDTLQHCRRACGCDRQERFSVAGLARARRSDDEH
jgi:MerR family transcriptional regulator, copper efflux regulator